MILLVGYAYVGLILCTWQRSGRGELYHVEIWIRGGKRLLRRAGELLHVAKSSGWR